MTYYSRKFKEVEQLRVDESGEKREVFPVVINAIKSRAETDMIKIWGDRLAAPGK